MTSLRDRFGVSERRACVLTSQHRSSQRYRRRLLPEEALLRQRLQLLARRHPRYGYRRIHALLRREGWACNRKRVQRLWRDEGLRLPAKTKRRRRGPRMPGHLTAVHPDQVWAIEPGRPRPRAEPRSTPTRNVSVLSAIRGKRGEERPMPPSLTRANRLVCPNYSCSGQ